MARKLPRGGVPMNMNVIGDRTYLALKSLYLNLIEVQSDPLNAKFVLQDWLSYAKEYSTIKLCCTRRSGHTTAIGKLVNEFNKNWLVMSYNLHTAERVKAVILSENDRKILKETSSYIDFKDGTNILFSSHFAFENEIKGRELDGIIVDVFSMMPQKKVDLLYETGMPSMLRTKNPAFIFIE